MPQFTAISRDSHAGKKWQRFKSYGFASKVVLAPVVGVEVARAALALPLAFLQEAERFGVDEVALNALADDVFLKLRKASALPIAYAQMLSAGQLGIFQHLARLQAQLRPPPAGALPESIDSLFEMPGGDTIQFR